MTPDENPLELGMDRLVDFAKPDFIGKTALLGIRDQGVTRQMAGVFISGDMFQKNNEHRWAVIGDPGQVGVVTSAVYSPRLERNIGLKEAKEQVDAYIGTQPALQKKMEQILTQARQRFIRWLIGILLLAVGVAYLVM